MLEKLGGGGRFFHLYTSGGIAGGRDALMLDNETYLGWSIDA
jgi:hypothetical protein